MKTLTHIFIFLYSLTIAASVTIDENYLEIIDLSNPYNDEEILITGFYAGEEQLHTFLVDLINDTVYINKLDKMPKYTGSSMKIIISEINSKHEISYLVNDTVYIYNSRTGLLLNSFIPKEIGYPYNKIVFTNNDNEILLSNLDSNIIAYYDFVTGKFKNDVNIEVSSIYGNEEHFNTQSNQLAKISNDSIYFFSLLTGKKLKTYHFESNKRNFHFRDNGSKIVCTSDSTLYIIDSENGTILQERKMRIRNPIDIQLSANLRYAVYFSQFGYHVMDLYDDKFEYFDSEYIYLQNPFLVYVTSNFKRAFTLANGYGKCFDNENRLENGRVRFLYDLEHRKPITTIAGKALISPTNNLVSNKSEYIIVKNRINDSYINSVMDLEGKLIEYLDFNYEPVLLFENTKNVSYVNLDTFYIYNLESSRIKDQFFLGINKPIDYYFTSIQGGKIVIRYVNSINIYDYESLTLDKSIDINFGFYSSSVVFDNEQYIHFYKPNKLIRLNILDGSIDEFLIDDIPSHYSFKCISPNGKYLVYLFDNSNLACYNTLTKEIKIKHLHEQTTNDVLVSNIRILENTPIVYYFFHTPSVDNSIVQYSYDFDIDLQKIVGSMHTQFNFSPDKLTKIKFDTLCFKNYSIEQKDDPQSSVETTTTITGGVYPNPASDFIKLDLNMSAMNSSIEIYDAYGKRVMSTIYTGEDIDISKITAGVYFVITPSHSYKFIKL